jgi:hypothetical protein
MKITLLGEVRDPSKHRCIFIKYDNGKSFLIEDGLRVSSIHVRPISYETNISNLARITDAEFALECESVGYTVVRELTNLPRKLKKEISEYLTGLQKNDEFKVPVLIEFQRRLKSYMYNGN